MEPDDLRLFLRAVATGNLSAAGREVGMSPAVASKRIANLERKLGVTLLHRTTRHVSTTAQGQIFEEHAARVLSEIEGALAAVGQENEEPAGRLRVTAPATLARRHIAPLIAEFLATYPRIELDVQLADSMLDLQQEGIDVALRVGVLQDSTLIARKIAESPRVLCASPDYVAKHGMPERPEDLQDHNCLYMAQSAIWVLRDGDKDLRIRVSGNLNSNSGELLREGALIGLGIAIKSIWDVEDLFRDGRLVHILPDFPVVTDAAVWAVYQPRRFVPAKIRAFVDFFVDRFGRQIRSEIAAASCRSQAVQQGTTPALQT